MSFSAQMHGVSTTTCSAHRERFDITVKSHFHSTLHAIVTLHCVFDPALSSHVSLSLI